MIDDIDRKIANILQEDARTTNADIARQLGMAPSAIFERIRKLEASGLIRSYAAHLDPQMCDLGLLAFVFVRAEEHIGSLDTGTVLAQVPEVQEVHHVAGEDCYLVKVRVANTAALSHLLRERFGAIASVLSTRTTIVLTTVKESSALPLPVTKEH